MEHLFGRDVPFNGNVEDCFKSYNSKVAQITLGPFMSGGFREMIQLEECNNIPLECLIIHSSMMINLGNKKKWSVSVLQKTLNEALKYLKVKPTLKIGVVTHIGKGDDATIEGVVEQIKRLVIPEGVTLYLENAAGQGKELGVTLDELIEIFEELPPKIKLCIDTQHAFAAGLFAWRGKEEIDDFFETIELYLPGRLELIHLNDSKKTFGSRVDRHETLLNGYIWSHQNGEEDLKYLLDCLIEKKIPLILETPNPADDLKYILNLYSSSDSSTKIEG